MKPSSWRALAVLRFLAASVLLGLAGWHYQEQALAVQELNEWQRHIGTGQAMPGEPAAPLLDAARPLDPGVPAATVYCLLFAVLFFVEGVACLLQPGRSGVT